MFGSLSADQVLAAADKIVPLQRAYAGVGTRVGEESLLVIGQRAEGPNSWPITVTLFKEKLIDVVAEKFTISDTGKVDRVIFGEFSAGFNPEAVLKAVTDHCVPVDRQLVMAVLELTEEADIIMGDFVGDLFKQMGGPEGLADRAKVAFASHAPGFDLGNQICHSINSKQITFSEDCSVELESENDPFIVPANFHDGMLQVAAMIVGGEGFLDLRSLNISLVGSDESVHLPTGDNFGHLRFNLEIGEVYTFRAIAD